MNIQLTTILLLIKLLRGSGPSNQALFLIKGDKMTHLEFLEYSGKDLSDIKTIKARKKFKEKPYLLKENKTHGNSEKKKRTKQKKLQKKSDDI